MKNLTATKTGGYSLVEVLVAITVLLIALVGPLTIAQSGLKRSAQSKDNTMAVFLAQEGIEALVKVREEDALGANYSNLNEVWGTVTSLASLCPVGGANECGVRLGEDGSVTSVYRCAGTNCALTYTAAARVPYKQGSGSGTATIYTREMQITVNNSVAEVVSEVSWGTAASSRVTLKTYVYNIYYEP